MKGEGFAYFRWKSGDWLCGVNCSECLKDWKKLQKQQRSSN